MFPVIFRIVITTTLMSLRTPRPLAIIPIIFRTSEMMTITASKALKTSKRYMKLLAKLLSIISAKNIVKNAVSIIERIDSSIPKISAIVSQKRIKRV